MNKPSDSSVLPFSEGPSRELQASVRPSGRPSSVASRSVRGVVVAGLFFGATGLVAAACSGVTPVAVEGEGCSVNSDCDNELVCVFETCHTECNPGDDRDCEGGARCVRSPSGSGVCQLDSEVKCLRNTDCEGEAICGIDGACRDQCVADRDCFEGQVCTSATCAEEEELVDGVLPTTGAVEDAPCSYNSECREGLVCIEARCAYECLADRDCYAGRICNPENHRCESL